MIRSLSLLLLASAPAGAFELSLPLDCRLGDSCFIQQYMDHDPGPGAQDFNCGPLSYQDHEGTDFALPSLAAMQAGVAVLAAAPGVVRGIRDDMPDIAFGDPAAPPLEGRDCGNGVVIAHEGGWETQYCHMKRGSVTVRAGQRVAAGDQLGQVGLSGRTQFPHLHLSLRQNRREVDPFAPASAGCGATAAPLWAEPIPYQAGGIIAIGLTDAVPGYDAVKAGTLAPPTDASAPALVVWAYVFGSRAGDVLQLQITGPDGTVVAEDVTLDRTQAQSFRALGKRLGAALWPSGRYTGTAILLRDGAEVDRASLTLAL